MIDNTTAERPTFVTHLECGLTGERHEADRLWNLSRQGKPLLVRYDLAALRAAVSKDALLARAPDLWRYREFLPVRRAANIVSLGEYCTPVIAAPRAAAAIGAGEIRVKDEGRLPTGSFKARGMAVAVSMAKELGVRRMAMPSAGNAGAALAAYAARAGIEAFVFYPEDAPEIAVAEIPLYGGHGYGVNGLITDLGPIVEQGAGPAQWFSIATLKEPYRIEGKKTMGLELAAQFNWSLPDVVFYPTGGGTGLIGMWKAWQELLELGWISGKLPRLVAVQASTCAPIVRAYDRGATHAEPWENAHTVASGIRVPAAIGDFLMLNAIRESKGFALAVDDADILKAVTHVAQRDGFLLSPEGAATYVAYRTAADRGMISPSDKVILFNCATGLKYPMPAADARIDIKSGPVDIVDIVNKY